MRLSLASLLLLGALAAPAHAQTTAPAPNPFGPGAAKPNAAPPPNPPAIPARPAAPAAQAPAAQAPSTQAPSTQAPAAHGTAIYPTAIAPKYAKEPAGSARQHTCLDQYNANKAAGGAGNGGLNWIEKGGGYYSECNKRLKG